MDTAALGMQGMSAASADIWGMCMSHISPKGKDGIGHQERIAQEMPEGGYAEHDVAHGTDGSKADGIKQRLSGGKLTEDIVEGCNTHDEHCPNRRDEQSEVEGNGERIERGMIIEMAPRLWVDELDGAVENG